MKNIKLILIVLILSSCSNSQHVVKIPVPERPNFELVTAKELSCVSQETFNKIAKRTEIRDSHFTKLEDTIRSTH